MIGCMIDLNLDKVVSEINKSKPKRVLIQLPDGLKPKSKEIYDFLKKNTCSEIFIWLGSCFGACDLPFADVDLVVQIGHAEFK